MVVSSINGGLRGGNKMDKTFLEKRIRERAEEQFEKDYEHILNQIVHHPIFGKLKIKQEDKDIPIANFGCNYGYFNGDQESNSRNKHTNFDQVKEKVIEEYIKEETDRILERIGQIDYLYR